MPTYTVRSPITRGTTDDEGNNHVETIPAGKEVELTEEEAAPLLESGTIVKADSTELAEKEQRIAEIEEQAEELRAELLQLQQEAKDLRVESSRDPNREHATLVANPQAAPPKPADGEGGQYNEQSRAELVQEAKSRGLNAGGTKGDLVNRLEANDREEGRSSTQAQEGGEGQQDQRDQGQQGQQQSQE